MPSFSDSIFLFILALLLFGPKKLPVLARELGKWVGEFRRASNEFKMQMEEELRQSEQADRMKQIEAIEAAAPAAPALPPSETDAIPTPHADAATPDTTAPESAFGVSSEEPSAEPSVKPSAEPSVQPSAQSAAEPAAKPAPPAPLPIAHAGELKIMPPSTGLPTPRKSALSGMLEAIPAAQPATATPTTEAAEAAHGN